MKDLRSKVAEETHDALAAKGYVVGYSRAASEEEPLVVMEPQTGKTVKVVVTDSDGS